MLESWTLPKNARTTSPMQVVPLPYGQASFQHKGRELTRYHFGRSLIRYGLWVHQGVPKVEQIDKQRQAFTRSEVLK